MAESSDSETEEFSDPETDKNSFRCDICFKTFVRKYNLQRHLMIHRNEKPFECEICSKTFSRPDRLDEHQQTHSDMKTFTCPHCPKKFPHERSLRRHQSVHGERWPCQFCSKTYALRRFLDIHVERDHEDRKKVIERVKEFACPDCEKSYDHLRSLRIHQKKHHIKQQIKSESECESFEAEDVEIKYEDENFDCPDYPMQIKHESEFLKREEALEDDNEVDEDTHFSCSYCEKTYSHQKSLKSHQKKQHRKQIKHESESLKREKAPEDNNIVMDGDTHLSCSYCEKTYSHERSLKSHQKKHHQVQIKHETESLKREEAPKDNNKVVDEDMHFSCSECGKKYSDEKSLESHQKKQHRMHIKRQSESLEREEAPEDNDKVMVEHTHFSCSYCGKTYSHEKSLKSHQKKQHRVQIKHKSESLKREKAPKDNNTVMDGDTHFICPVCGKKYSHEKSLESHQKKEHPMQMKYVFESLNRKEASKDDNKVINGNFSWSVCAELYERSLKLHHMRQHPTTD